MKNVSNSTAGVKTVAPLRTRREAVLYGFDFIKSSVTGVDEIIKRLYREGKVEWVGPVLYDSDEKCDFVVKDVVRRVKEKFGCDVYLDTYDILCWVDVGVDLGYRSIFGRFIVCDGGVIRLMTYKEAVDYLWDSLGLAPYEFFAGSGTEEDYLNYIKEKASSYE